MPLTSDTQTNAWIASLTDAGVKADVEAAVAAGGLTYSNMLKLLQDVAASVTAAGTSTTPGALTADQLSSLQAVAANLNNGVSCSDDLVSLFQQCVDGSPMNAEWNGGSATATALGNLAVGSSATQVNELIGKWFLGTDLPDPTNSFASIVYQNYTSPLFGPTGGPSTSDIAQGIDGDCDLFAALIDMATNDPSLIKSMIVSDGNGVYGVRFYIDGVETWVTVNTQLPTFAPSSGYSGLAYNDLGDSDPTAIWASLVEKAWAQLSSSGQTGHAAVNSYQNIYSDSAENVLSHLADVSQTIRFEYYLANWNADKAAVIAAVASGDDVIVTSGATTTNAAGLDLFVGGHAFGVVGYDATTGDFILRNPWGDGGNDVPQFEASMYDIDQAYGDFVISNSASDAVEIRASSQDQMAVGTTTSVGNLLSVVDTTGAEIAQYMLEMVGTGSINLNGATNLATTAQTAQGQVVVSAADLAKVTVGVGAAYEQTLLAWAGDGTVWSPVSEIALNGVTTTAAPSQNVDAFGSLTGVTMTSGSGANATTFVSNLALASMFNLQGADLTEGSYQINLLSGGTVDLNGASPWALNSGQVDIDASDLSKLQFTLAPGATSASFDVFYTDGTHPWSPQQTWTVDFSGVGANAAIQDYDNGDLPAASWVNDDAASIFANLDSLQTMLTAGVLQEASITDSTAQTETITGTQFVSDMGVLSILSGKFSLDITDMSAATIATDLASLETEARHIESIISTGGPIVVSTATFTNDQAALDEVAGGFGISDTVADITGALPNLAADAHINSITAADGPIVISTATFTSDQAALDKVVGGFGISDTVADITAALPSLAADIGSINSITATDGPIVVSTATFAGDQAALDKVVGGFGISDTEADITNTLPGLLMDVSHIASIASTDTPVTVGADSFIANEAVLNKIGGGFDIADGAPGKVEADLGAMTADISHIDSIASSGGPIVASAATFESDQAALNAIVGGFDIEDQSANFVASLSALQADVSHIKAVSFADPSTPTLNLTSAQASDDASLLAKIVSPYVLNVANANGSTTTTGFNGASTPPVQNSPSGGSSLGNLLSQLLQALAVHGASSSSASPAVVSQAPSNNTLQSVLAAAWHH